MLGDDRSVPLGTTATHSPVGPPLTTLAIGRSHGGEENCILGTCASQSNDAGGLRQAMQPISTPSSLCVLWPKALACVHFQCNAAHLCAGVCLVKSCRRLWARPGIFGGVKSVTHL